MNERLAATRLIVVERFMPHPPQRIWLAPTEAHLIEQWLMRNDVEPRLGAGFMFWAKPMGDWDGAVRCVVTAFDGPRRPAIPGRAARPTILLLAARASEWSVRGLGHGTKWPLKRCPPAGRADWSAWSRQPPRRDRANKQDRRMSASKTSAKTAKPARPQSQSGMNEPKFLAGGNPQIAKREGDAPQRRDGSATLAVASTRRS